VASQEEVATEASVPAASILAAVVEVQEGVMDVALEHEAQQDVHPWAYRVLPEVRGSSETKVLETVARVSR
jgi:hypothetical protein